MQSKVYSLQSIDYRLQTIDYTSSASQAELLVSADQTLYIIQYQVLQTIYKKMLETRSVWQAGKGKAVAGGGPKVVSLLPDRQYLQILTPLGLTSTLGPLGAESMNAERTLVLELMLDFPHLQHLICKELYLSQINCNPITLRYRPSLVFTTLYYGQTLSLVFCQCHPQSVSVEL